MTNFRPDTLILAIATAADEIENSVAIKKAEEVDPARKRTVGVLTKLDLEKEPPKVESLVKVLDNQTLPLVKGYIGVINHNNEQVN